MKSFFKEFKTFISKGNALDLAVGLVIGTAFNNIVKSLVSDIIMPLISLIGNQSLSSWFFLLRGTEIFDESTGQYVFSSDAVVLYYGQLIQSVVDFFVIALSIFVTLKLLKKVDHSLEEIKEKIGFNKEKEHEKEL
jgi:large conductance mechanosensitive channel